MAPRLTKALPYLVVLAIAAALLLELGSVRTGAGDGMNPASWPKAILLLTMVVCAYEVVKRLVKREQAREAAAMLESVSDRQGSEAAPVLPAEEERYPHLLWLGAGLTVGYVAVIEFLGFFLATWIYLAAFTWVGRFRRPGAVLALSLGGSLAFSFMFMKVVYVSLPLGQGPFRQVSLALMQLMGVK